MHLLIKSDGTLAGTSVVDGATGESLGTVVSVSVRGAIEQLAITVGEAPAAEPEAIATEELGSRRRR